MNYIVIRLAPHKEVACVQTLEAAQAVARLLGGVYNVLAQDGANYTYMGCIGEPRAQEPV